MARIGIFAAALVVVAGLAGCTGFSPLYAEKGVAGGIAHIAVEAPNGRTAYLIRESLDDAFGKNRDEAPAYKLTFTLEESRTPRGLGPDNAASRYELNLLVDWQLSAAAGAVVKVGRTEVLTTYGAADSPYAGVAAQQDGQERAATEAARRIRLEIAQYFARQG
jgi:LPS-assembly lipoprotein